MNDKFEAVEATITSKGWKILKDAFLAKKEGILQDLLGLDLAKKIGPSKGMQKQEEYKAIDKFYENVSTVLDELKTE